LVIACLVLAGRCAAQEPVNADQKGAESAAPASVPEEHSATSAADEKLNPMVVDPDLAVFTAIVFLVLFGVLSVFAWPQISAALLEREKRIEDQIAAATAKHEDAKRVLAEHEARLAAAAGEVRALLEEARRDAEVTKNRIVAEARKAGEDEKNRALLEIKRAKDGAVEELAAASANVAIDLAGRVVKEKITPEEHANVVRDALGKLAAATASRN
jgi:F-type H+-transporting ATPase subunit b